MFDEYILVVAIYLSLGLGSVRECVRGFREGLGSVRTLRECERV